MTTAVQRFPRKTEFGRWCHTLGVRTLDVHEHVSGRAGETTRAECDVYTEGNTPVKGGAAEKYTCEKMGPKQRAAVSIGKH